MMVFSNTTPFIALCAANRLDLMPAILGGIHVVDEVADECAAGGLIPVPDLRALPWITVVSSLPAPAASILMELDHGERNTINTAADMKADLLVMDERIGRNVAEYMGLKVIGTLGILLKAKAQGLIPSFRNVSEDMQVKGIRFNPKLVERLAREVGE
ncbi:MAG: DUF3368 domain-containing protein [Nitrospirae bacterium]|nr:DUF3368 domain-containing protein [Nitrospirota bacterium]